MKHVLSMRGYTHAYADCVTCGADALSEGVFDSPAPMRRWAERHARRNPGHQAHHQIMRTRVYLSPSSGTDRSTE